MAGLVPAISIIGQCGIPIEIAGSSLVKPGDNAIGFAIVTVLVCRRDPEMRLLSLRI
jgi:hypothetical protein